MEESRYDVDMAASILMENFVIADEKTSAHPRTQGKSYAQVARQMPCNIPSTKAAIAAERDNAPPPPPRSVAPSRARPAAAAESHHHDDEKEHQAVDWAVFNFHRKNLQTYQAELANCYKPEDKAKFRKLIQEEYVHGANAFVEVNKVNLDNEVPIDLHGLVSPEVSQVVNQCIKYCEIYHIRKFALICGLGYGGTKARLLPLVKTMLARRELRFVDDLNGLIWVYVL